MNQGSFTGVFFCVKIYLNSFFKDKIMSCGDHEKMNPIVHGLYHVKEWDKKMAKKFQDKFGLTDYQMKCIAFAKGFIIGAMLL